MWPDAYNARTKEIRELKVNTPYGVYQGSWQIKAYIEHVNSCDPEGGWTGTVEFHEP